MDQVKERKEESLIQAMEVTRECTGGIELTRLFII